MEKLLCQLNFSWNNLVEREKYCIFALLFDNFVYSYGEKEVFKAKFKDFVIGRLW
ncbi:MAG: hypothetical protein J5548_03590 [Prevotella sp.]|nr:hypothetical protein [Prevotella sp.]